MGRQQKARWESGIDVRVKWYFVIYELDETEDGMRIGNIRKNNGRNTD
jgi:hypothetical protein